MSKWETVCTVPTRVDKIMRWKHNSIHVQFDLYVWNCVKTSLVKGGLGTIKKDAVRILDNCWNRKKEEGFCFVLVWFFLFSFKEGSNGDRGGSQALTGGGEQEAAEDWEGR